MKKSSFNLSIIIGGIVLVVGILAMSVFNTETVKQKVYDAKADLMGTPRIARVYSEETGRKVAQYEDSDMRFEIVNNKTMRIWMGDKSKKVVVMNMGVIIEDK